ncbi:MAG TPA: methylmalonyl-CoA mutase family protein, partial [Bacillota bacterium]
RTQQILAYETGVADTIDPLAGSYYVEHLTNEIERRAREYIRRIDEMGGAVRAIEQGYIQREIQDAAYRFQREVESKQRIIVGVNAFQIDEEPYEDLLKVDPEIGRQQAERLRKLRSERDGEAVRTALERLERAARGSDNLLPYILDAVRVYATLGEICNVLRGVFGEYQPRDEI